jgi:hypothetical protein
MQSMKTIGPAPGRKCGASLVEVLLAVGVLAVAMPLVWGAIAESGRSGVDAVCDARSGTILTECFSAIARARAESPGWFEPSPPGHSFPPQGDVWALAFGEDGRVVGRVTKSQYDSGLRRLHGAKVRIIAAVSAEKDMGLISPNGSAPGTPPAVPLRLTVTVEHPAVAPLPSRVVTEFYSLLR